MATGDAADFAIRIRQLLPRSWFPDPPGPSEAETAPVLMGVLTGIGAGLAVAYSALAYVGLQVRLSAATDENLDLIAADAFGTDLPRNTNEADAAYRGRIKAALLPAKGTRAAVIAAVQAVAGTTPLVIEPLNAADTKGRGSLAAPAAGGGYGYGTPWLRYGSVTAPAQFFVTVSNANPAISGPAIFAAIGAVLPVGVIAWVRINAPAGVIGSFVVGFNTVS